MITTKNIKTMKTKLYTTALIALITIISINLSASTIQFQEEAYINDIPFNTEVVYLNLMMEEEAYINDIPFSTQKIAEAVLIQNSVPEYVDMEEEAYIDDIPFSTSTVVAQLNYEKSTQVVYNFNDEEYIDDIPFNTIEVAFKNEKDTISNRFMIASCVNLLF